MNKKLEPQIIPRPSNPGSHRDTGTASAALEIGGAVVVTGVTVLRDCDTPRLDFTGAGPVPAAVTFSAMWRTTRS